MHNEHLDPGSIPGLGRSPGEGMATHSNILAGECHGQRSLLGYSPRGCKVSDMTEWLTFSTAFFLTFKNENNYAYSYILSTPKSTEFTDLPGQLCSLFYNHSYKFSIPLTLTF